MWGVPAFALLTLLLIGPGGFNQPLFLALNHALYLEPGGIWLNITLFGDAGMIMVLVLPFVGRRPDLIWSGLLAGLIAAVLINGGKELFMIDRPPSVLAAGQFHQIGNRFGALSFPSGHTAAGFALAGVVAQLDFSPRVRVGMLLFATLIGLSRIAIGAHWPMDIAGGMLVGWIAALAGVALAGRVSGEGLAVQRGCALLLLFTVFYLVFLHKSGDAEARLLEIIIPLVCLGLALPGLKKLFLPGAAHE